MELVRVSQRHVKEFRDMWIKKGWGCAICGKHFTETDGAVVDHDHDTGVIRGCLHNTCNRLEGELKSFAERVAKDGHKQWLIKLGIHVYQGGRVSNAVRRMAKFCHKGVGVDAYLVGLANYLSYHATPRCRMIHPSHRFPNEGGNVKKRNPRWRKFKRKTK